MKLSEQTKNDLLIAFIVFSVFGFWFEQLIFLLDIIFNH
jgi:hypothetical protein